MTEAQGGAPEEGLRAAGASGVVPLDEEGVDELLARVEACVARLGDQSADIEALVGAYEEGVRLLAAAENRLSDLRRRAGLAEASS